jgi:hypothetical protein
LYEFASCFSDEFGINSKPNIASNFGTSLFQLRSIFCQSLTNPGLSLGIGNLGIAEEKIFNDTSHLQESNVQTPNPALDLDADNLSKSMGCPSQNSSDYLLSKELLQHPTTKTQNSMTSPFDIQIDLTQVNFSDNVQYANLKSKISDLKKSVFDEAQLNLIDSENHENYIQNLGVRLFRVIERIYQEKCVKSISQIPTSEIPSKIKFCKKEPIRYKGFPVYGEDLLLYTGFMICGKPQGAGILSDSDNKIYYSGDFLKGKIHSENATLYWQLSSRKNLKAAP